MYNCVFLCLFCPFCMIFALIFSSNVSRSIIDVPKLTFACHKFISYCHSIWNIRSKQLDVFILGPGTEMFGSMRAFGSFIYPPFEQPCVAWRELHELIEKTVYFIFVLYSRNAELWRGFKWTRFLVMSTILCCVPQFRTLFHVHYHVLVEFKKLANCCIVAMWIPLQMCCYLAFFILNHTFHLVSCVMAFVNPISGHSLNRLVEITDTKKRVVWFEKFETLFVLLWWKVACSSLRLDSEDVGQV